jgi:hypothetical protein
MSGGGTPIPTGPLKDRSNMDKSKPASTPKDKVNVDSPPPPVFNPEDLIGRTFLMDERKMAKNTEDESLSSLKIMSPCWKKTGSSSEYQSTMIKLRKLSHPTRCWSTSLRMKTLNHVEI